MQVKQPTQDKKKKGAVCEVICHGLWVCIHQGNYSSPLEKRLSEHKNFDEETWHQQWDYGPCLEQPTPHGLEGSKTRIMEGNYWKIRVLEALHTHQQQHPSKLGCGLVINPSWLPLLDNSCMLLIILIMWFPPFAYAWCEKRRRISLQRNCSDYFIFLFQVALSFTRYVSSCATPTVMHL